VATIRVPNLIGLPYPEAAAVAVALGLSMIGPDPDGPPLAVLAWPNGIVVRQEPPATTVIASDVPLVVWVRRRGGEAGDREPLRPRPPRRHGALDLDREEADT
jgi:PASTA domain-containing protein